MHQEIIIVKMNGWKIGGLASFSLVTVIYGIIVYSLSLNQSVSSIFSVLKTYPIIVLIFVPIGIVIGLIVDALRGFDKPKRRRKKGQIWVSTVLYVALGIVAMTLILGAGLPMITKMKERNTVIESKAVMHAISGAITTVVTEGPGSKRVLDPVIIKGGKLYFDVADNKVRWEMKTSAMMMEPCPDNGGTCTNENLKQKEGDVDVFLLETIVVDEYIMTLVLEYPNSVDLVYEDDNKIVGAVVGSHMISIRNTASTLTETTVGIYIS
jgi:hypothetical protein